MSRQTRVPGMARLATVVIVLCALAQLPAYAVPMRAVAGRGATEAVAYIRTHQNADGGFSEPDASSDPITTCWGMIAGAAAGEQPLTWTNSNMNPMQYLSNTVASITALKDLEMMTIAIKESGGDPRSVAGRDLVSMVKANIASDGKIGADVNEHCWGMLALATVGDTVPAACSGWLVGQQRQDGGWGESDQVVMTDTALAIQALTAIEEDTADAVASALELLRGGVNGDGGFKGPSTASDARTTTSAVEAIHAGGEDPTSIDWSFEGKNPVSFLNSLQAGDGHFQYSNGIESQPVMTTAMAVPAVIGDFFPLSAADANSSQGSTAQSLGDLGTAGAGMSSGSATQSTIGTGSGANAAVRRLRGPAAGAEGSATGAIGFWLFLTACSIYAVLLIALAALVGTMVAGKPLAPPRLEAGRVPYTPA